jgi:hypothetical protein
MSGHSWPETARILGTSTGNACQLWHRALEKMVGVKSESLEKKRKRDRARPYAPRTPEQKERRRQLSRMALASRRPES